MSSDHLRYFAYGSNMSSARIEARLGRCRSLGPASLCGYSLRFHKRGLDGSGKCDAFFTGDDIDVLLGVLFELDTTQAERLDRFEGTGYRRRAVAAQAGAGTLAAFVYAALPSAIAPGLRPYPWYLGYLLAGAREAGLPAAYLAGLGAIPTTPDPDPARVAENARILAGLAEDTGSAERGPR